MRWEYPAGAHGYVDARDGRREECARLNRRHLRMAELPVIGLTAAGCIEDRERCIASGMNDYLTKPFEFDDLVAVMGKYVS